MEDYTEIVKDNKMDFSEKIEDRLDTLDRNKAWLARQLKVSRQSLSGWLSRGQAPTRYVNKIANILGCSTDWLLAEDLKTDIKAYQLSEREKLLLLKFRTLSKDEQERELTYLRGLTAEQENTR